MTKRELQFEFTQELINRLIVILEKEFGYIFSTGDNLTTLTFDTNFNGEPAWASLKLTLHKPNYNLDEEIEKFELMWEEKEMKKRLKEEKKNEKV